jgi:glycosyltransferase involved in cell wall biosynthesis
VTSRGVDISIVVPVYNEEASLGELHRRLGDVLEGTGRSFELIFCDDGSTDGSFAALEALARSDARTRVISFRRNYGQTAALDAGFRAASGAVVVALDADLQNDPEDIPRLLAELDRGADVVKGWRRKRQDPLLSRRVPSRIANWLISRLTRTRLHDYGCTLSAYRREILDEIRLYGEMHRLIPAYAAWAGARIAEVDVRHHARRHGRSKVAPGRAFRVLLDLMTVRFLLGYSSKPLYFFGKIGAAVLGLCLVCLCWSVAKKLVIHAPVYTDPFFYATIFLGLAGLQILLFGLLAEMAMRTYYESRGKPPYVIRKRVNLED